MYIVRWLCRDGSINEAVIRDYHDPLLMALEHSPSCQQFKLCDSTGLLNPAPNYEKWVKRFHYEEVAL